MDALTFDPGYLEATATEARTAGPRLVAPCSLKLNGKVQQTFILNWWTHRSHASFLKQIYDQKKSLCRDLLINPLCEVLKCLCDTVRDFIGYAMLPYMFVVDQCPVPQCERSPGAITIYHNLFKKFHSQIHAHTRTDMTLMMIDLV